MTRFSLLGALTLVLGACSSPGWPEFGAVGATASLINGSGIKIGEANFAERRDGGVDMELTAWDLPPGIYGMHIHDSGFCDNPDFQTAGGHFNPFGRKHGLKNPQGPHAGDLPNLVVPPDGRVSMVVTLREVTLREGVNSLLRREGTSLVIHANPDDQTTDPAGNSGARMACGVIQGAPTGGEIEAR